MYAKIPGVVLRETFMKRLRIVGTGTNKKVKSCCDCIFSRNDDLGNDWCDISESVKDLPYKKTHKECPLPDWK